MSELGAVLRCSGSKRAVQSFLASTTWKPLSVYWKGQLRFKASMRPSAINGFNVNVSNAGSARQAADAAAFIRKHLIELRRLKRLRLHWVIDFSIDLHGVVFTRSINLPQKFLASVARLGGEIEVSAYTPAQPDMPSNTSLERTRDR